MLNSSQQQSRATTPHYDMSGMNLPYAADRSGRGLSAASLQFAVLNVLNGRVACDHVLVTSAGPVRRPDEVMQDSDDSWTCVRTIVQQSYWAQRAMGAAMTDQRLL